MKTSPKKALQRHFKLSMVAASCLIVIAGSAIPGVRSSVLADAYDDKINTLKAQNAQNQANLGNLQSQASTYQEAIAQLQNQIGALQASINANTVRQGELVAQITAAQAELDQKKAFLASNVKAMYVDGTPSNIEILANSHDLSEFVDKQEYRSTVQRQLQDTMTKIAVLQKQLREQQTEVVRLLGEQKSQQNQLASDRAQQDGLLALNESQQSDFTFQIRANNAQQKVLEAQQRAAYAASIGAGGRSTANSSIKFKNMTTPQYCGGDYRYCDYGLDQHVDDPWGFGYARECVHYVLSSLANQGKFIPAFPAGGGNAYQWVPFTTRVGAAVLVSDPQPGDVAYMPLGGLGHVGMVDYVNEDGTVHVSQMNYYPGRYNTMDLYITPGVQFLRFHN